LQETHKKESYKTRSCRKHTKNEATRQEATNKTRKARLYAVHISHHTGEFYGKI